MSLKFRSTNRLKNYDIPTLASETIIFNPNEINSGSETLDTKNVNTLLSNYLPLTGGTVNSLNIDNSLYVNNQQQQSFGTTENNLLQNTATKTTNLSYNANNTTVSGDLTLVGNLNLNNNINANKIGSGNVSNTHLSYISGLTSSAQTQLDNITDSIQEVENNITTINNNISNINNDITTLNNDITTTNNNVSQNATNITSHTNLLATHTNNINDQLLLINGNATSIATLNTQNTNQQNSIDGNTANITTNTNNILTNTTKLTNISYDSNNEETTITGDLILDDVTLNSSLAVDGTFTIQNNDYSLTHDKLNYLSSINQDYATTTNNILTLIGNNDNDIATLNTTATSHSNTLTSHGTRLDNIENDIVEIQNDVTTIEGYIIDINNDLAAKATSISNIESDITALETQQSTNMTNIQNNTDNIALKQDIINSFNRLNVANLSDGSITNNEFNTLSGIDTTKTIQTQLNTLTTTVNNLNVDVDTLETLQNLDLTNIPLIQSDITDLQTLTTSHTDRLDTNDFDLITTNNTLSNHQTSINQNTANISTNATNIGTNTTNIASNLSLINTKHDTIDANNLLPSEHVSTNVNASSSTLDVVLQSLTDVNTTQSTLLTNINNSITTLTNEITSNDTEILNLQNKDITHDNLILTIQGDMSTIEGDIITLNNTKQNNITTSNRISSDKITTNIDANSSVLDIVLQSISDDLSTLDTTKQDVINDTDNKLAISKVDLTGSNLVYADYGSSINAKFASLDGQISTLTTLQDGDVVNFTAIENNFTTIENELLTKQDVIDSTNRLDMLYVGTGEVTNTKLNYIKNLNSDVQSQIDGLIASNLPSILYDGGTQTTTITNNTNLTTLKFDDTTQQTTAFTNALKSSLQTNITDIANLQTQQTTNTNNISQNTTDITNLQSNKQDVLNDTDNKLAISKVDLTGSNLVYADYNSSINTKFTNIDSVLSSQTTLNNSFTNDISTLNSGKQNTIDGSNKLDPQYIQTSGGGTLTSTKMQYLSSITSDLQTQLNNAGSSFDTNNSTFTGTTTADTVVVKRITEKIDAAIVSFTSNILTIDISSSPNILYFDDLTSNTNFQLNITNSPSGAYKSYTFTLWIDTTTYKAYANTIKVNGTTKTILFNGGASSIDISTASSSTVLIQQITVIYLISATIPDKVISNITIFKA